MRYVTVLRQVLRQGRLRQRQLTVQFAHRQRALRQRQQCQQAVLVAHGFQGGTGGGKLLVFLVRVFVAVQHWLIK